jgi:hypothetical protein
MLIGRRSSEDIIYVWGFEEIATLRFWSFAHSIPVFKSAWFSGNKEEKQTPILASFLSQVGGEYEECHLSILSSYF